MLVFLLHSRPVAFDKRPMNRFCLYSLVGLFCIFLVGPVSLCLAQQSTTTPDKVKNSPARAKVFSDREKTASNSFIVLKIITPDRFEVTASEVPDPNRLVFDFIGTKCRKSEPFSVFANDVVSSVRFGSHADKMRVVIDVKTPHFPFYEWKAGPKQLIIRILESGKRPEGLEKPTRSSIVSSPIPLQPTTLPTRVSTSTPEPVQSIKAAQLVSTPKSPAPSPTVTFAASPHPTLAHTQTPQLTTPKLPVSVDADAEISKDPNSDDVENLLHPVEPDSHPTISVRPIQTPTLVAGQVDGRSASSANPTPGTNTTTQPTIAPTLAPSPTQTQPPALSPTPLPVPTKAPVNKKTVAPLKTAQATATSIATRTSTASPQPTTTPTSTATTTAAASATPSPQVAVKSVMTAQPQPTITPTAVPTLPPITDFHLLNYRFDYLEPGRIPVLKLVLDKSRPQAQISKIDSKTYTIDILNCSLSRPGLALAQYPPAEFRGFLLVSSTSTDTRLTITINVESGTTLGTFVRNNEIWVKRL